MPRAHNFEDLTGTVFGRLTVLEFSHIDSNRGSKWKCKCKCGTVKIIGISALKAGQQSCGCFRLERVHEAKTTHGQTGTSTYKTWESMVKRCHNPNDSAFPRYGGQGIKVCKRWRKFANFYADMGDRPEGTQIDRKNNKLGYFKSNCKWSTRSQQCRNRTSNNLLTYKGETKTLAEWNEITGHRRSTIPARIKMGWSVERAIGTPKLKTWSRHK